MQKRILVTGAGGFLGSHICQYFGNKGHTIAAVGRFSAAPEMTAQYLNVWKFCGMTLPDKTFTKVVRDFQPNLLVHCAGTSSVPESILEPYSDFQRTVEVCAFTLEITRREAPGCKFILISSASVYGNPTVLPISKTMPCNPISPYGYHKRMCEILVDEYSFLHGISAAILRIFSAYGERLHKQVIFDLCRKFADPQTGGVEVYGTGKESRDFIHAQDVARAIECIYNCDATGYFNLASGTEKYICEVVQLIKETYGSKKDIIFSGHVRPGDPLRWQADISDLKSLGFKPQVTLAKGIKKYCAWFKNYYKI